ncbi:TIGR03668 family PPOX class F420-dependent oxidoreductase [Catellatospora sp. NPDC049609]|uniref:TIGR03668 family PPOX class F420-dependent oxidoreductase n=1 Tax=Catellatospora sp. NPDC049609 TaxID=3155505 RepID=UPI0034377036
MSAARDRFAAVRVARLATADPAGVPHLVPVVFAVDGDTVYTAVDRKPKRTRALRRLANIAANPRVCLLADHYEEDWSRLWWVRADGTARVLDVSEPEAATALALLAARYRQYAQPPPGPVIAVDVTRWTAWSGAGFTAGPARTP